MRGTIQALPLGKNFGFLIGEGERFRRFFPASAVAHKPVPFDDLEVDDLVEFEPEMEGGQARAAQIVLMAKASDMDMDGNQEEDYI